MMKKTVLISIVVLVIISSVAGTVFLLNKPSLNRPQEPVKPYPYRSEDVTFQNVQANITLAGTLTLPLENGTYPAVILITGSGPQNRDEEILGHKLFLVISDHLTRNGIAVLRFDDRGVGQSTGNFKTATSQDFAADVESAVDYLKTRNEIDKSKIGLAGHSEGGIIAPMVAARSGNIAYMILLASPAIEPEKALLIQDELIARALGVSEPDILKLKNVNSKAYHTIAKSADLSTLKADLTRLAEDNILEIPQQLLPPKMTKKEFIAAQIENLSSPWFQYLMQYDPAKTLEKVKCPVLAINGGKDLQVTAKENLPAIRMALNKGGNTNVTTKELPNLNHLFQDCNTGSPMEYGTIEQTFSPEALTEMTTWILKQVK